MFVLLLLGVVSAVVANPALLTELAHINIGFRLPEFGLHKISWDDVVTGTLLFTLPQIPLTLGNAVVAITAENNELFPDRPVTERTMTSRLSSILAAISRRAALSPNSSRFFSDRRISRKSALRSSWISTKRSLSTTRLISCWASTARRSSKARLTQLPTMSLVLIFMTRRLAGVPLARSNDKLLLLRAIASIKRYFAFIGLQESFDVSLACLGKLLGIEPAALAVAPQNVNPDAKARDAVDQGTTDAILYYNALDCMLYDFCRKLFAAERARLHDGTESGRGV